MEENQIVYHIHDLNLIDTIKNYNLAIDKTDFPIIDGKDKTYYKELFHQTCSFYAEFKKVKLNECPALIVYPIEPTYLFFLKMHVGCMKDFLIDDFLDFQLSKYKKRIQKVWFKNVIQNLLLPTLDDVLPFPNNDRIAELRKWIKKIKYAKSQKSISYEKHLTNILKMQEIENEKYISINDVRLPDIIKDTFIANLSLIEGAIKKEKVLKKANKESPYFECPSDKEDFIISLSNVLFKEKITPTKNAFQNLVLDKKEILIKREKMLKFYYLTVQLIKEKYLKIKNAKSNAFQRALEPFLIDSNGNVVKSRLLKDLLHQNRKIKQKSSETLINTAISLIKVANENIST